MYSLKIWWIPVFLQAFICLEGSGNPTVQRQNVCHRVAFVAAPARTMYPKKGELFVNRGRTLRQEAARHPVLKKSLDYAESSARYRDDVEPYGRSIGLNGNETLAIFAYTLGDFVPALHEKFNEAIRKGDDFTFPIYHYWLDRGVRRLLEKQGSQTGYQYRGNSLYFTFGQNTTTFPGFTSTSKDFSVAKQGFWSEGCTMMKILTHLGADISRLSNYTREKEVLFPPYERFTVKGYTNENGMPTVTLETQEPVITGTLGNAGSHETGLTAVSNLLLAVVFLFLF